MAGPAGADWLAPKETAAPKSEEMKTSTCKHCGKPIYWRGAGGGYWSHHPTMIGQTGCELDASPVDPPAKPRYVCPECGAEGVEDGVDFAIMCDDRSEGVYHMPCWNKIVGHRNPLMDIVPRALEAGGWPQDVEMVAYLIRRAAASRRQRFFDGR